MAIIVGNVDNFDEVTTKGDVLVDFYATWCGPCKMLSPELDEVSNDVDVLKVDIDENRELAKKYGVMNVPTLMYFKEDGTYDKNIGYMPKEEILKWIGK